LANVSQSYSKYNTSTVFLKPQCIT